LTRPHSLKLDETLSVDGKSLKVSSINTGVPHAVCFVDDVEGWDVLRMGRAIRNHPHYAPSGTNADFVQLGKGSHLIVRTYERGVEDETLACGTGLVASSLVAAFKGLVTSPVSVKTQGGEVLGVHFEIEGKEVKRVFYEGDVRIIYEAEMWEEAYL
jgi:diaminopimelate epimerase